MNKQLQSIDLFKDMTLKHLEISWCLNNNSNGTKKNQKQFIGIKKPTRNESHQAKGLNLISSKGTKKS